MFIHLEDDIYINTSHFTLVWREGRKIIFEKFGAPGTHAIREKTCKSEYETKAILKQIVDKDNYWKQRYERCLANIKDLDKENEECKDSGRINCYCCQGGGCPVCGGWGYLSCIQCYAANLNEK